MKIKLIVDLPICKEEGGKKGRVFEVIRDTMDLRGKSAQRLYYFIGDAGSECGAYPREVEVIE